MAKLNKDRIFKAADGYIRSGKVEKAIAEYEKWVAANPKDTNTLRNIGDLYARLGKNAQAIKNYTRVAEFYRNDGFNVRAIATYKMILRLEPQNESAMASLAELQVAQGLLMEAKSQYQTLVELYTKSGQKKRAAQVFKKLAEIDPSDLKVRYKFAEFLERQGQSEQAIGEYVGIADEFINKALVPEAIQIMEKGLRINRFNRSLRCKLAQASVLQGDYAKAVQLLSEIRGKYPDDKELMLRLGEAYMGAGNLDEAESVFSRLAELDPDNPEHTSRRAELAIGQGNFDRALELLIPVVDKLVASNEGDKAAALLQKLLSKDRHHIKTLVKLAEVHTVLKQEQARISAYDQLCEAYTHHGDYERAVHVAEQLVELEPENSQHKDRLRFLKSRVGGQAPAEVPAPPQEEVELPGLEPMDDEGLGEAAMPVEFAVEAPAPTAPPAELATEPIPTLTAEDEEHIKEKLTEAEVFVRYGLVDKAIDQLKDVLEGFRFHRGAREKLVEVYRDQGMTREAAEEMVELSRIYERLGDSERAGQTLQEARDLNPALEAASEVAAAEEIELTLTPEEELESEGLGTEEGMEEAMEGLDASLSTPDQEMSISLEEPFDEAPAAPAEMPGPEEEMELTLEDSEALPMDLQVEAEEPAGPVTSEIDVSFEEELEPQVEIEAPELSTEEEAPAVPASEAGTAEEVAEEEEIVFEDETGEIAPEAPVGEELEEEIELEIPDVEVPREELVADRAASAPAAHDAVESEDEIEVLVDDEQAEEISVELPEMGGEASAPEIEIPDLTGASPEPPVVQQPEIPAPAAPPAAVASPIATELQEVDEYVSLGLYEDARDSLRELLRHRPGDPAVLAKIEELGFSATQLQKEAESAEPVPSRPSAAPERASLDSVTAPEEALAALGGPPEPAPESLERGVSPAGGGEPFVDLASALSEEMLGTQSAVAEPEPGEEPAGALSDPGLDEIFREFKKGVEKQLGTEDYDTRYNLGIAYKEMGLLDEAIAEFQLAAKDETRLLECCSMLGLCFLEKGMPDIAIKWFEKGLAAPGRNEEEYHGLRYDLAQAHEAAGEAERALQLYMDIYRVNARFRDVKDRVRDLQAAKN